MQAYCVKCRKTQTVKDPQRFLMKNDRPAFRATCEVCGTAVIKLASRIGKPLGSRA